MTIAARQDLDLPATRVTDGRGHYFFGYYDKCPWDETGRYILAQRAGFMDRPNTCDDELTLGLIDTHDGYKFEPFASSRAWCWQQGCMLQWLPTEAKRKVIYNQFDGDRYVAVIQDVFSGQATTLGFPIYAVSPDGRWAVSLNFARVNELRPGYGYKCLPDLNQQDRAPANDGIYRVDLFTGKSELIVSLDHLAAWDPPADASDPNDPVTHWVNHLQVNPTSDRFLFLHRYKSAQDEFIRTTRLFTAEPNGERLYCVSDHQLVSHFDWRDSNHIIAFANRHGVGKRYFLFRDRADFVETAGQSLPQIDGHCTYSPDRQWILTDTYPDPQDHCRTLLLYHIATDKLISVGRFYADPAYWDEIRCDLHPRFSRDGRKVCIDSIHEGSRQMYVIDVGPVVDQPG